MFARSHLDALGGPAWLASRRAVAFDAMVDRGLPTTDEEVWRYSRIDELDLGAFEPLAAPPLEGLAADVPELTDLVAEAAAVVIVQDGFVVRCDVSDRSADLGLVVSRASDLSVEHSPDLGGPAGEDFFSGWNRALGPDPVVVRVPSGVVLEPPVVVMDVVTQDGAATFPALWIVAEEESSATVVEWQTSSRAITCLTAPSASIRVGPRASLQVVTVQDRGPRVWQLASQTSVVEEGGSLRGVHAGLGGDYARARTECRLVGSRATGDLFAAYFGTGSQMLDYRTFQEHLAPNTTSHLLFKGAVDDDSRSVYTGLIHVGKDAPGTDAFQTNRNVKLSDAAWADSVPNLEIENNDVRCSHASTVGPVDEEQLFYLTSRGVAPASAERLIVRGFFREVLETIPEPGVATLLEAEIDERLVSRMTSVER